MINIMEWGTISIFKVSFEFLSISCQAPVGLNVDWLCYPVPLPAVLEEKTR